MPDTGLIRAACRRIGAEIGTDPRYAHTSHLRVLRNGVPVFDEHYRGPAVADVFSITKTVVATVARIAARCCPRSPTRRPAARPGGTCSP